jgi:hypothetical protein
MANTGSRDIPEGTSGPEQQEEQIRALSFCISRSKAVKVDKSRFR